MNEYAPMIQPTLSRDARILLDVVKATLSDSPESRCFLWNTRMMKATGLRLDELRAAQRELINAPHSIEYGRLKLQTVRGGCEYTVRAA